MATIFVDVSAYLVFAYGGPNGNNNVAASISLTIPNAFAFLDFYPEGTPLPPLRQATHASGRQIYYVSYRYEQLANVLDLLRNEKPIKFFYRDDNLAAYLTTADEPVGEGES
ncbi:MAG TPA: hypothetical protein VJ725_26885 [Thermoanaerobaculia bacterium]|nr:hypothetical protein [Thermoanaerobaculia bacterium]